MYHIFNAIFKQITIYSDDLTPTHHKINCLISCNYLQKSFELQTWLQTENLLPHQTVEKLTKWTVYDDDGQARTHSSRGHWESEDPTQEMAETQLISTQVLLPFL